MSRDAPSSRRNPLSPHQTVALALLVLAAVFVVENRHSTTIRFLIPEVTAPLWLALFISGMLGVAVGVLLTRKRDR
ncbi:MAG: LapA family protein [Actinomycetota bacterium]|nr:LapA family protein [Actinomycetota bacterium]